MEDDDEEISRLNKNHAWFVAFAPSEQPRIAVVVFVEHGKHGAWLAPIAQEIIKTYLGPIMESEMVAVVDNN